MNDQREQGWLQKIFEDADKRVSNWPDWKKELVDERGSSNKAQASSDEEDDDDKAWQAHG